METNARMPTDFEMFNSAGNWKGHGTGAITSPMAASFREEKLALSNTDLAEAAVTNTMTSANARGDRG